MTTPTLSRRLLGDAAATRLGTVPGTPVIKVYRGEIRNPDGTTDPPLTQSGAGPDPARRVAPYVVLYSGVGSPDLEPDLEGGNVDLSWPVHLIVGAGFEPDLLNTVDRIHAWVHGWQPIVAGLVCGQLRPPSGFDPGPPRHNTQVSPSRWWTPLQYVVPVTT